MERAQGGAGPSTLDRVAEFCDGWMPILRPGKNPVEKIPALRERLARAGRDSRSPPVLEAAGLACAILGLASEPRDAVLPRLDAHAAVIR